MAVHAVIPKTLHLVCSDPWIYFRDSLGRLAWYILGYPAPEVCSPEVAGCNWTRPGALLAASVLLSGARMESCACCAPRMLTSGKGKTKTLTFVVVTRGLRLLSSRSRAEGGRQVVLRTLCLGKFSSLCPAILLR